MLIPTMELGMTDRYQSCWTAWFMRNFEVMPRLRGRGCDELVSEQCLTAGFMGGVTRVRDNALDT